MANERDHDGRRDAVLLMLAASLAAGANVTGLALHRRDLAALAMTASLAIFGVVSSRVARKLRRQR